MNVSEYEKYLKEDTHPLSLDIGEGFAEFMGWFLDFLHTKRIDPLGSLEVRPHGKQVSYMGEGFSVHFRHGKAIYGLRKNIPEANYIVSTCPLPVEVHVNVVSLARGDYMLFPDYPRRTEFPLFELVSNPEIPLSTISSMVFRQGQ